MTHCVLILGGSFDPVHNGHIALGAHFCKLLEPDELRVIPAGNPWQKERLLATADHREEMLRRAFEAQQLPIKIDRQEIERKGATYTIDTVRAIRDEIGPQASIVLLLGIDQLNRLDSWHEWRNIFNYVHICAASRPGYPADWSQMPHEVAAEFSRRKGTLGQIRSTSHGLTYLTQDLAVDVSATDIRLALQHGAKPASLIPPVVLDYIEQFHLYKD